MAARLLQRDGQLLVDRVAHEKPVLDGVEDLYLLEKLALELGRLAVDRRETLDLLDSGGPQELFLNQLGENLGTVLDIGKGAVFGIRQGREPISPLFRARRLHQIVLIRHKQFEG